MYDQGHNGIQLDAGDSATLRNDELLQGFLSKNDLQTLLGQTNCVGVRIYNTDAVTPAVGSRIIAVGVRENGSELNGTNDRGYVQSRLFDPTPPAANGNPVPRSNAVTLVSSLSEKFSSFFSRTMLQALLAGNAAGVGFHKTTVRLDSREFSTHAGAPYEVSGGQLQIAASPYLKSDQPCPGICAQLTSPPATDFATAPTTVVESSSDSNLYLLPW